VEKHDDHVNQPPVARERQQQSIDFIGRAADEIREGFQRVKWPRGVDDAVVLLDDDGMYLEEPNVFEDAAGTVLAAGGDDVSADQSIPIAARFAHSVVATAASRRDCWWLDRSTYPKEPEMMV
jgi:hypothetical protein